MLTTQSGGASVSTDRSAPAIPGVAGGGEGANYNPNAAAAASVPVNNAGVPDYDRLNRTSLDSGEVVPPSKGFPSGPGTR